MKFLKNIFECIMLLLVIATPLSANIRFDLKEDELEIEDVDSLDLDSLEEEIEPMKEFVHKFVLENGMTVLIRPVHSLPKVSMQVWYNVGSKDEHDGERGLAHLLEHMVFKGTLRLSETDISAITHMLSGSTNAFTWYDYTGYLFNMPVQHWHEALALLADCMQNIALKDDHLNSEMKAVIQELKMKRDDYKRTLMLNMITAIFPDHPYHYPTIGYKQDLFDVHADRLRKFYKKHYWPNNATLVIVGDVNVDDALAQAKKYFEQIPGNPDYKKEQFYFNTDIVATDVTIFRDVQQPFAISAYVIPGAQSKNEHLINLLELILGVGKGSRLHHKLVDELHLATSLSAFALLLFEHGIFMIVYEPRSAADIEQINAVIQEEIDAIAKKGLSDAEYTRALKNARMSYYHLLENIESQAREIGKSYLATGDKDFAFHFLDKPKKEVEAEIQLLLKNYFRPSQMHTGKILPLSQEDKKVWLEMQKAADEYDTKFLQARKRKTPIEPPLFAKEIQVKEAEYFDFPKPQEFMLANGIKVFTYDNKNTPTVALVLDLKADTHYDSAQLPGIYNFLTSIMQEGTQKYTAAQLAHELEDRGISLSVTPDAIVMSMLAADVPKGLELLEEVMLHPRFDEKEIEKTRVQLLAELKNFWDEPRQFSTQLIKEKIYKGHPYSKNILGTQQSIQKITKKDLINFHKKVFSPDGARLAIVGDVSQHDIKEVLENTLGKWKGPQVPSIEYPQLEPINACEQIYPINRDQVVLCFAGLSVERTNPDYDKLLLFDQIFGGGDIGSMHSRLFQIREQTGLFYGISGSLTRNALEQPGLVLIKTMVSLDRLDEAEKTIKDAIDHALDDITPEEFLEAKHAIINSIVNLYATNTAIAGVFLGVDRYGFPKDYHEKRAEKISEITIDQMKDAVKKVLNNESLFTLKVGRLQEKQ